MEDVTAPGRCGGGRPGRQAGRHMAGQARPGQLAPSEYLINWTTPSHSERKHRAGLTMCIYKLQTTDYRLQTTDPYTRTRFDRFYLFYLSGTHVVPSSMPEKLHLCLPRRTSFLVELDRGSRTPRSSWALVLAIHEKHFDPRRTLIVTLYQSLAPSNLSASPPITRTTAPHRLNKLLSFSIGAHNGYNTSSSSSNFHPTKLGPGPDPF
jgi:hypothetical protein